MDYVVVATKQEACWQTEALYFDPSFAGDIKIPLEAIPTLPMNERKIISRRAALELKTNAIVNLGYGIPADIAAVAAEENSAHMMMTTEAGAFSGVPASKPNFGNSYNAKAMIEHGAMLQKYRFLMPIFYLPLNYLKNRILTNAIEELKLGIKESALLTHI